VPAVPRLLRAFVLGVIAIAVIAPATAANADPSPADLQRQISQSQDALEKIIENYNLITEQLKSTQASADDLNAKMAPLQSNLDSAYANVGQIAVRAYKGGGVSPMAVLLSEGSTQGLLDQLSSLNQVARAQQADIQTYARSKQEYDGQKKKLDDLLSKQQSDQKALADQKGKIESDLAKLTDMQRRAAAAQPRNNGTTSTTAKSNGGGGSPQPPPPAPNIGGGAGAAVQFAYGALGKPYIYAAAGPAGYDCSGLTQAAWRAGGKSLPHNAAMQWNQTTHISASAAQPGDLVFYSGLGHVAMYIGNGKVIHAPHAGTVVQVASVNMMTPYGYGRVR
jgi:cell wall-associated NlpC family hydrolase